MPFPICHRHNNSEKTTARAVATASLCFNIGCPETLKVICGQCLNQHSEHKGDILSIEDVSFLLERSAKLPGREMAKPITEALDVIKQLKLIKEFRKKIDLLEKELQKEAILLIDYTESLVQEYEKSKEKVNSLTSMLQKIEEGPTYKQFFQNSKELLVGITYNARKDKFEFNFQHKEQLRVKALETAKQKIEELRDYSMKIIEVVLNSNDSDSEQPSDDVHRRRLYETLKHQVSLDSSRQEELLRSQVRDSSVGSSQEKEIQTSSEVFTREDLHKVEGQLKEMKKSNARSETDFKLKLHAIVREIENMHRELCHFKDSFKQKKKHLTELGKQLKQNVCQNGQQMQSRQDLVNKFMQIWQSAE